jgi:hypothetical protein
MTNTPSESKQEKKVRTESDLAKEAWLRILSAWKTKSFTSSNKDSDLFVDDWKNYIATETDLKKDKK